MAPKRKLMSATQRDAIRVQHTVDWLNITYWNDQNMLDVYPPLDGCYPQGSCRPLHGYDRAVKLFCGGIRMWHQNRSSMGIHYQFSGDALRMLREECGGDEILMLRKLYHEQLKQVSRIDIATDVINAGNVDDIMNQTNKGRAKTRLKPHTIHSDWQVEKNAKTLYFGAPTSNFRVRVYDKGHQMKALWEAWTRIEAQVRDEGATAMYKDVVMTGSLGGAVKTVKSRLDFPLLEWYQYAMTTEGEKIEVPRKPENFEKWMRKQVIPAIESHLETDPGGAINDLFQILYAHFEGVYND